MALPDRKVLGITASFAGALLPLSLITSDHFLILPIITLLIISFALYFLFTFKEMKTATMELSLLGLGFLYVPLLLIHLQMLRVLPLGKKWLFLMMVIVMAGDTAAYYIGTRFGNKKLCKRVSPNKSVEGALGGLAGSLIGALISNFTFFPELTKTDVLVTAILLGVFGQLGDLFESFLKRSFEVKDSGTIFPGHGGMLDRLDSILFAAPFAFYYAAYIFQGK